MYHTSGVSRFSALTRSSSSSIGSHDIGPGKPPFPLFTAVSQACFRLKLRRVNFEPPLSLTNDSAVGDISFCRKGISGGEACRCGACRASKLTDDVDEISQHFRHTKSTCTALVNRRIVEGDTFVCPPSKLAQPGSTPAPGMPRRVIEDSNEDDKPTPSFLRRCGAIPYRSVCLFPRVSNM